jgi:NAD(P)-dependent dehydrogenase (short-subunit alcohol dehydrogenase family)
VTLFSLTGKVAIITGSTRGIGLATAMAMQNAGAKVVISSENIDDVSRVSAELGMLGITADVTNADSLAALIDGTIAHFGRIDILVCNAGITGQPGSFAAIEMEDFDRVMAINLRSQVVLSNLALPHIAANGGGSVILMASISALRGNKSISAYALSKAGVAQLARNLAVEWGPSNVRVNAISPGFIHTDLSAPLLADPAFMKRRMAMTPLRRPGTVDEVAGVAVFLASPAGAFIHGHNLVVDGGTVITDGS